MNLNRVDLRKLILILAAFSVALTLLSSLYSTYQVQRELLIDNTFKSNQAYATKLAHSAEIHLKLVTKLLDWSAHVIAQEPGLKSVSDHETQRLFVQTNAFNSVIRVDEHGALVSIASKAGCDTDELMQNPHFQQTLEQRTALISSPFTLVNKNYLILLSSPIINSSGEYHGFIAAVVDLHGESAMSRLLNEHVYQDETYLYIVDQQHRLIIHADPDRVGDQITSNPIINAVLDGQTGHHQAVNSLGIKMLAGYAPIPSAKWGVVSQRSLDQTLELLNIQMMNVFLYSLPLLFLTGLFVWFFASQISKPLWSLAQYAEHLEAHKHIQGIKGWYYEIYQLKEALLKGMHFTSQQIDQLQTETLTDPLTGILNRRGLQRQLDRLTAANTPFSIISLDIDHFKRVNDVFGHDVGDEVIKSVTQIMRDCSREHDTLTRVGGEEFLILLPDLPIEIAKQVAERLRVKMAETELDKVGYITISLGVTHWPETSENVDQCLKLVDVALYRAKQTGRNKVVVLKTDQDL